MADHNKLLVCVDGGLWVSDDEYKRAHDADIAVMGVVPTMDYSQLRDWLGEISDEDGVCDFCSAQPIVWAFPCEDHESFVEPLSDGTVYHQMSLGFWAACAACADLIQRGDRDGICERAVANYAPSVPDTSVDVLRQGLRGVQDNFWVNRTGPGEAIGEESENADRR